MTKIIKNGIQYNVDPSVVNAKELLVTTPEVEVLQTVDNGVNFFTNESLRNVWRNMAVGIPLIWGYSRIT